MARFAILIALVCSFYFAPALAREIYGYDSDSAKWMLGETAEESSLWGFRAVDLGWEGWEILYDDQRLIEPREMQNPESPDKVTVKCECLLVYSNSRLEMVLFDIADSDTSYRKLARIFNESYDDEDNKLVVDKWNHRVWTDNDGDSVVLNRYIDVNGEVRTRMAYLSPSKSAQLANDQKPEWFSQITGWMERRR